VGPTDPGSGFKFYLNDADGWFCGPYYCAAGDRTGRGSPGRNDGDGPGSIFSMLFAQGDPDYRVLLADRIHKAMFHDGALTPSRNSARLSERCAEIQRAFYAESARWNYLSPAEWANRRDHALNTWFPTRTSQALAQWRSAGFYPMLDAPTFNQQGGIVLTNFQPRFTGPFTNAIYYTTNGTDPRLPGGAISPAAQRFRGVSDILLKSAIWKARAKSATEWSALNEVFFQVGPSALAPGEVLIRELNFNPPGSDATEFIELANVSSRAVNLRGARFVNGVTFAFADNRDTLVASGQRVVLVADLFAFQQRYGLDLPVAGVYAGSLDNGGETLTLVNASEDVITRFRYDGAHPWPVDADGGGYTLVLAHPSLGETNAHAWRASAALGGTPGTTDATSFSSDPGADIDRDGLPALVEYALGTSDTDAAAGPGAVRAMVDLDGRFVVSLRRNQRADDVLIWVEGSDDLASWFAAALFSTRVNPDGTATETWGLPVTGHRVQFLRVRVVSTGSP
jgi:hypothetical protein